MVCPGLHWACWASSCDRNWTIWSADLIQPAASQVWSDHTEATLWWSWWSACLAASPGSRAKSGLLSQGEIVLDGLSKKIIAHLFLTHWRLWSSLGTVSLRKLNWSNFVNVVAVSFIYRLWHFFSSGRSWDKIWASLAKGTGTSHCLSLYLEEDSFYHLYSDVKPRNFWGVGQSRG